MQPVNNDRVNKIVTDVSVEIRKALSTLDGDRERLIFVFELTQKLDEMLDEIGQNVGNKLF
jgi:hypothetical protein